MKKGLSILISLAALFAIVVPVSAAKLSAQSSTYAGFPTFSIESVEQGKTVTIKTNNLPPNDTFNVTMGKYGTKGVNGTSVGTLASGTGGTLTVTYNIPEALSGLDLISIRLQSPTTGYFAYNWFFNSTATATVSPTQQPAPTATPTAPGYSGFPTFSITAVVQNESVTISGKNFPAGDTYTVYFGEYGTKGIGGTKVSSTDSGSGGTLTATYDIPDSFDGKKMIAIRLASPTTGYFAYNWFYNNTTP